MKKLVKKLGIGLVLALIVLLAVTSLATAQGPVPYYGGGSYYYSGSSAGYYPYYGRSYGSAPLNRFGGGYGSNLYNPYGSWSSGPHNRFGGGYGSGPYNPYGSWSSGPHNRFGGSYSW